MNRTFFFAGWQGTLIDNVASTANVNLPTDDMRRGDFSTCGQACNVNIIDPLTDGGQPFPEQADSGQPLRSGDRQHAEATCPACRETGCIRSRARIRRGFEPVRREVDQQLTPNDQISNRYFIDHFDHAASYTPGNLATYRGGTLQSRVRTQNNVTSWKRTFTSTLLNETHFGYNRVNARRAPPETVCRRCRNSASGCRSTRRCRRCRACLSASATTSRLVRPRRARVRQQDELDEGQAQHPVRRRNAALRGRHRQRVPSRRKLLIRHDGHRHGHAPTSCSAT